MASRRELIEAEDFHRRRGVAALERGDTLAVEDVPRRPNAALVAGVVLVLLIAAGSAITAYLTDRAPTTGWPTAPWSSTRAPVPATWRGPGRCCPPRA